MSGKLGPVTFRRIEEVIPDLARGKGKDFVLPLGRGYKSPRGSMITFEDSLYGEGERGGLSLIMFLRK